MRSCISNLPYQIFYGLAKLEELDLSGNNLVLKSSIFKDLQSLKNLKLHACVLLLLKVFFLICRNSKN